MATHLGHRHHHRRWYLPHRDYGGAIQAITYRLADAFPGVESRSRHPHAEDERRRRIEAVLDSNHGCCVLRDPRAADIVVDTWRHFDRQRYALIARVVMPNHVHVVIEQREGHALARVVESWKSYTAKAINRAPGRNGRVWQPDYWDRFVRDERHLAQAIRYVHANPVKARLVENPEDWEWSSAGCAVGRPGGRAPRRRPSLRDGPLRPSAPPHASRPAIIRR